jgi:hypothetical protein
MLKRNMNKYNINGVTVLTTVNLRDLFYPLRIDLDCVEYLGSVEVTMRRLPENGEEQREADQVIDG